MRTVEISVFNFDELSDKAKQNAIDWYRETFHFPWDDEYAASVDVFCERFGVDIEDHFCSRSGYLEVRFSHPLVNFEAFSKSDFTGEEIPTGFYADNDLWMTFYNEFDNAGPQHAFYKALETIQKSYREDRDHYFSDENIAEEIENNEYEFYEDGTIFRPKKEKE